jgi:hypothetical protein
MGHPIENHRTGAAGCRDITRRAVFPFPSQEWDTQTSTPPCQSRVGPTQPARQLQDISRRLHCSRAVARGGCSHHTLTARSGRVGRCRETGTAPRGRHWWTSHQWRATSGTRRTAREQWHTTTSGTRQETGAGAGRDANGWEAKQGRTAGAVCLNDELRMMKESSGRARPTRTQQRR